jgi:nicotinamide-nucleotide amidase
VSARAAIVITGTEVLDGRVSDRNGPWLAERLRGLGVELTHVTIVGDRPDDMLEALRWCASLEVSLIVTSGGLGPTADDLTATVVGGFCGREMVLDAALEERIAAILRSSRVRWAHLSDQAIRAANRKQAVVPIGATILEPVGTAPGLVVPSAGDLGGPTVVVLPGPPRELQALWEQATRTDAFAQAIRAATVYEQRMLRLYGLPESEIATTLREAERVGVALEQIEVTTCVRSGELEIVTRYEPHSAPVADALEAVIRERHSDVIYSDDGTGVDEQVAALLLAQGLTVAVAESCTGGLLLARLTDRPGASAFVRGGIVAYSDTVKEHLAAVAPSLIQAHGAVSQEVASALAEGARERLGTDIGIGVTGVAGPGGGTASKPVGLVWFGLAGPDGLAAESRIFPGDRTAIRMATVRHAVGMLRAALSERTRYV